MGCEIRFYRTLSGRSPMEEFLDSFDGPHLLVLVSGFAKKSQKTPPREIARREERKRDYLNRKKAHE